VNLSHLHLPHGITPGELELALVVVVVLAVLATSRHARTIAKLAAKAAAAPAPAPKSSGGKGKFLLLAGVIGGGIWAYVKTRHPVAAVNAAPAPSPSPSPTPGSASGTPPITAYHFPLTGGQILVMLAIAAVVAIVLLGPVLRRSL
jgi:hypothetical protein